MRKIRVISALLFCVLIFTSFSSCSKLIKLEPNGKGEYYDKKNDITYKAVSNDFQPMAYGEEYARWKINGDDIILHKIEGLDPTKWLYCVNFAILYCADDIETPNPLSLNYSKMLVCVQDEQIWSLYSFDDEVKVTSILINMTDGESMKYPSIAATHSYLLMFESAQLPKIYYAVPYYEYSETQTGCFYFREDNQRCIKSNELFSKYVLGE